MKTLNISIGLVFVLFFSSFSFAVEEELGQFGESIFHYESLSELKPFITLSVSSPKQLGLTEEVLAQVSGAYQLAASLPQNEKDRERQFGKHLRNEQPLLKTLFDLDVSKPLGLVVFAGEETVYPMLYFQTKSRSDSTSELQSIILWNRSLLSEQDLNQGVTQRSILQWKTQGNNVIITVPELSGAIPADCSKLAPFQEPEELFSLKINMENAPEQLFYGLLLVADFAIQYGDINGLRDTFRRSPVYAISETIFSDMLFSEISEETRPFYLALTREIRAYLKEIRQYRLAVRQDAQTQDCVISSSFEYIPDSSMDIQRQTREKHPQTLHGFYQPKNAAFALGDGAPLRPRQKKIMGRLLDGIAQIQKQASIWAISCSESEIQHIRDPEPQARYDEKIQKMIEISVDEQKQEIEKERRGIDFSHVDADHPATRTDITPFGPIQVVLLVEENIPYLEKQLNKAKEMKRVSDSLSEFYSATASSDWQESATTLNEKNQLIGAVRLKKGNLFADFLAKILMGFDEDDLILKQSANQSTAQIDYLTYKGFRFMSSSSPVLSEQDAEKIDLSGMGRITYRNTQATNNETPLNSVASNNDAPNGATKNIVTPNELKDNIPSNGSLENQTVGAIHPAEHGPVMSASPISQEEMQKRGEALNKKRIERRTKAIKSMPETFRGKAIKTVFAVSDDVFCYAIGLDNGDLEKTLCEAIDRQEQEKPFDQTLVVFRPKQYAKVLSYFGPLFLEASDSDYFDFIREMGAMGNDNGDNNNEAITISSTFEGNKRTDTLRIPSKLAHYLFEHWFEKGESIYAPFFPPYFLEGGGRYDIP